MTDPATDPDPAPSPAAPDATRGTGHTHDPAPRPRHAPAIVRDATIDDAYAIATVRVRTWRAAYDGLIDDAVLDALDIDREAERRRERWAQHHADPRRVELVAERDGSVVGWAAFGPTDEPADDRPKPAPGRVTPPPPHAGSCTRSTHCRPSGPRASAMPSSPPPKAGCASSG